MFGVVVNTFFTESQPLLVQKSAEFAISLLFDCDEVSSVVVVDGSETPKSAIKLFCDDNDVMYVHSGHKMSFAQAYNLGASYIKEEWIALMASDIYVLGNTFGSFKNFIDDHGDLPIGCLVPYLSRSDLDMQQAFVYDDLANVRVPAMTLNLNVIKRSVFEKVKGLSDDYSGNYTDMDFLIKLKNIGLDVFMIDAYANHYGSLTVTFGTDVNGPADRTVFTSKWPEMTSERGLWGIRMDKLIHSRRLRLLYRVETLLPSKITRRAKIPIWMARIADYQRIDRNR